MNDLTEFQQRAVAVAVEKMLTGRHFNICDLREIARTLGRENLLGGRDFSALSALHCVDWADMGPTLTRMTREKCLELLGLPPETIEVLMPERPSASATSAPEKSEEPVRRLRLAFWRAR